MLDAAHEMRKFRPLPVSEAEVPPIGANAVWREEVTMSLNKLGMAQYRSAAEMNRLLARAEELLASQAAARQEQPDGLSHGDAERALVSSFLPVVDTFDLAYDAVLLLGQPEWKEQFDRFRDVVTQRLEQIGLQHLPGEGAPFNPQFHEAVAVVSTDDPAYANHRPDTVAVVYQRGFRWKGELLRRTQVMVVR